MKKILKSIIVIIISLVFLINYNFVFAANVIKNVSENTVEQNLDNVQNTNEEEISNNSTDTEESLEESDNNNIEENSIDDNEEVENKDNVENNGTTENNQIEEYNLEENEQEIQSESIQKEYVSRSIQTKTSKTIEDGIYKIETILNNKPAFDITDGSQQDGAKIQLWDYVNAQQQKFEIKYQSDGYYTIKSIYTNKVLAVEDSNVDNGTAIIQKTEQGTDDEKWIIDLEEDGTYSIVSKNNNLYIDVPDYNAVNGQKLQMHYSNGTTAQRFRIVEQDKKIENGVYKIESILNTKPAFDITDGSFENKAKIQLWDYVDAEQQKFEITSDGDGYYKIKSVYTGKVLAVASNNVDKGTAIIQKTEQGTDDEKWAINYEDNDEYSISSKINNLSIDVPEYNAVNGQKLQMFYTNGTDAQKFTISKESVNVEPIQNGDYNINSVSQPGESFDITDSSQENGAQIQVWSYVGALQQKFSIEYLGDGYYKIISKLSNKALTMNSKNGNVVGSNVIQQDYENLDTQKWMIRTRGQNSFAILSKDGKYAMELSGSGDGAKIVMNYPTGQANQKFEFYNRRTLTAKRTIEDGTYKIESIINNKPAFDITDGSQQDGAKIQLWDYVDAEQQKFDITCDSDGYYEIRSVYTGKVLAIENNKASNGISIIQKTKQGTDDEKWIINKEENGQYSINSKINNSSIDVPDYNAVNGQKLQLHDWNGETAQRFVFTQVTKATNLEDGVYRISMFTNQNISFDIDAGKRENGANLQLWDWAGETSYQQQFKLVYDKSSKAYTIYNINSGKVLDVQNAGYTSGTNVWQYEWNGTDAQKWIISRNNDGSYSIISKLNGLYLDISNGQLVNGANVQIYEGNDTDAQKFSFIKQTDKAIRYLADDTYRIATKQNNNIGFDITEGSKNNGAQIQLWDYVGAAQEEFNIYYEDGYYYIYSEYSDKVIQAGGENEIITQQTKDANNDAQKWILQPNGGSYNIISKKTGLYLDVKDGNFSNGNKIQTHYGNGNVAQLFDFKDIGITIDESKYPGIKEKINQIKKQHPNWQFEILYTGIDFNEAVAGEYSDKERNLVDPSKYQGQWISPNPINKGGWYSASQSAIAYFMDVRNFLNDVDIFQFQDVNSYPIGAVTLEGIKNETLGTFLQGFENDINNACVSQNVNPYFVLARLFQEQGSQGSEIGTGMKGPDGKTYYNPYNIGAQTGNEYETALATAMQNGWDSMQKALEAGIVILKENWLENYQNTLYQNKFDIDTRNGSALYTHQYMQNLSAPYSEGRTLRNCYVNTKTLESNFKFIIPVYEDMPQEASPRPSNEGGIPGVTSDKGPIYVKTVNINDVPLKLREEPTTSSNILAEFPNNGTVLLSVERVNGWYRIVTTDGKVGYSSGAYLEEVADVINCNDRVKVTADDVRLRYGPGTRFDPPLISAINEDLIGTRINKGTYYLDGFWWDEVVFDDGSKGFVATNYLQLVN